MGEKSNKPNPGVSIVIPTWHGNELLKRFLPSVLKAAKKYGEPCETIVCDDKSGDFTDEFLKKEFPDVRFVSTSVRKGFAGASNAGFRECKHDIVVLLNNDTEVDENFLKPLVRHFENGNVFAASCKCYDWDGKMLRDGGKIGEFKRGFFRVHRNYDIDPGRLNSSRPYYSFYGSGAFCAFDSRKLKVLGGFDESFAPFNWEDADLCYRAWKRGWEVHYEPASIAGHRPGTTIGRFRRVYVKSISRRNRLLFVWKNLSDTDKQIQHFTVLFLESLLSFLRLDVLHFASLAMAFSKLPEITRARREEKASRRRTDREILSLLRSCYQRDEVMVLG
jgi:GT2 family glycosyltransferase